MEFSNTNRNGTVAGTLLSVLPNILSEDVFKTVVLATIGAVVSFGITLFLRWLVRLKRK